MNKLQHFYAMYREIREDMANSPICPGVYEIISKDCELLAMVASFLIEKGWKVKWNPEPVFNDEDWSGSLIITSEKGKRMDTAGFIDYCIPHEKVIVSSPVRGRMARGFNPYNPTFLDNVNKELLNIMNRVDDDNKSKSADADSIKIADDLIYD